MFHLRDYQSKDLEKLYRLDQECFEAGISYSRAELNSFIQRRGSFCLVAELQQEWSSHGVPESTENRPMENHPILSPTAREKSRAQNGPVLSPAGEKDGARSMATVKFEKGTVAGFVVAEVHPKGYGHIITIDVRQQFRRMELGSKLLEACEERVRQQNAFMIVLEVAVNNLAAITFYKRHKFSVARTIPRYYKDELDAFFMTKRL